MYRADADLSSNFFLKNEAGNQTFTFAFYIYSGDASLTQTFCSKGTGSAPNKGLSIYFWVSENGSDWIYLGHASTLSDNTWYHVGFVKDGDTGNWRIRIHDSNGLVGTDATGTGLGNIHESTAAFYLGYPSSGTLGGNLDEFVVFDKALTVDEIDQIWAGTYGAGTDETVYPDTFVLALAQETLTLAYDFNVLPPTLALNLTLETSSLAFDCVLEIVTFELTLTQEIPAAGVLCTIIPATLTLGLTQHQPLGFIVTFPTCLLLAADLPPPAIFADITIIPDTLALADAARTCNAKRK